MNVEMSWKLRFISVLQSRRRTVITDWKKPSLCAELDLTRVIRTGGGVTEGTQLLYMFRKEAEASFAPIPHFNIRTHPCSFISGNLVLEKLIFKSSREVPIIWKMHNTRYKYCLVVYKVVSGFGATLSNISPIVW